MKVLGFKGFKVLRNQVFEVSRFKNLKVSWFHGFEVLRNQG
jgi:hypothetical protein